MKRKRIISIIMMLVLVLHMGVVVTEAANPVHLLISKEGNRYKTSITMTADTDMQSFQFCLNYDGTKLKLAEAKTEFNHAFRSFYNRNKGAMLMSKNRDEGKDAFVLFLGVQSDEACAFVKKDTVISEIQFELVQENAGAVEQALALNTIAITVEVLEGSNGELIGDDERFVDAVYGSGLEHLNKKKFDENRYTELEDSTENNQKEDIENNSETETITDDSGESENENTEKTENAEQSNQTEKTESPAEQSDSNSSLTEENDVEQEEQNITESEETEKDADKREEKKEDTSEESRHKEKKNGVHIGIITGSVIGIVIILAGAGVFWYYKRKK